MSYLVLARKYRPTTFAEVVGQDGVVRTLKNAIEMERVAHAYLFTGARGVGKTTVARMLAKALNCEKGPTAEPDDRLRRLPGDRRRARPDVLEIDGASNTGVDDVRELRDNAAVPAGPQPLQDLHHRRGPHALDQRLQRPAQDARGAARPRQVHLRHHRAAQDSR